MSDRPTIAWLKEHDERDRDSICALNKRLKVSPREWHEGCHNPVYSLDDLRVAWEHCEELIPGALWALRSSHDGTWLDVAFVEYEHQWSGDPEVFVTHMMSCDGPGSETEHSLRECRHTYFGDMLQGYVYYMRFAHIEAALKYLRRFFDED